MTPATTVSDTDVCFCLAWSPRGACVLLLPSALAGFWLRSTPRVPEVIQHCLPSTRGIPHHPMRSWGCCSSPFPRDDQMGPNLSRVFHLTNKKDLWVKEKQENCIFIDRCSVVLFTAQLTLSHRNKNTNTFLISCFTFTLPLGTSLVKQIEFHRDDYVHSSLDEYRCINVLGIYKMCSVYH